MKRYVIKRIKDGKYWKGLFPSGNHTTNINEAMLFDRLEAIMEGYEVNEVEISEKQSTRKG